MMARWGVTCIAPTVSAPFHFVSTSTSSADGYYEVGSLEYEELVCIRQPSGSYEFNSTGGRKMICEHQRCALSELDSYESSSCKLGIHSPWQDELYTIGGVSIGGASYT